MGASEKTQHAIRRSTRLPLEVPVLVTSLDAAVPFSEQCNTTLVNAHGCGLIAPRALAHGIQVEKLGFSGIVQVRGVVRNLVDAVDKLRLQRRPHALRQPSPTTPPAATTDR